MSSALQSPTQDSPPRSDGLPGSAAHGESLQRTSPFRPDIDGMRGIAVLSLLAVHLFPEWVHGGFIGVEIFFVLTGYLISEALLRARDSGAFSYTAFYARRMQRVVPSLCIVLCCVLAFSVLFTYPGAAHQVGKDVFTGSLLISNITLWQEAIQRGVLPESRPLMHLWWLGVEAQFYLLWPMLLMLTLKFRATAWPVIVLTGLGSVGLCIAVVDSPASVHLLLLLTRWWELMAGALLAELMRNARGGPIAYLQTRLGAGSAAAGCIPDALSFCGLSLLLLAALMFDGTGGAPAWWGVLPTMGTFALLAAGPQAWINRALLSQPILRFYGTISYPLYLWHWPLLSFPAVMGLPLNDELRVIILIASVVLAALTHEMVGKRHRFGPHSTSLPICLLAALIGVGALGLLVEQTYGLLASFPEGMRNGPGIQLR